MEYSYTELPSIVRELAQKSRLIRSGDLCAALEYSHEDCVTLLDGFVTSGFLRKTTTTKGGQTYYWLTDLPPVSDATA